MSFIYAEREYKPEIGKKDTIKVYCDTKVSTNNSIGACVSQKLLHHLHQYGLVKSTIVCPEFCISFAGNNVFLASKLFYSLYEMRSFDRGDVLRAAYDIHIKAADPSDIEFIICSAEYGDLHIDCIKNKILEKDVPSAWLGSYTAFNYFQGYRHQDNTPIQKKTESAFRNTVEGCGDDSVGGFPITAQYYADDGSFEYVGAYWAVSIKEQLVMLGDSIRFYTASRDGGMSYNVIPKGVGSLILDIDQMPRAILYSRDHRYDNKTDLNKQLFGLMLPMEIEEGKNGEWICK